MHDSGRTSAALLASIFGVLLLFGPVCDIMLVHTEEESGPLHLLVGKHQYVGLLPIKRLRNAWPTFCDTLLPVFSRAIYIVDFVLGSIRPFQ